MDDHKTLEATRQAHEQLRPSSQTPFSSEGFEKFIQKVDEFIGDLAIESARIMKRHQADTISPAFVQQGCENLAASNRRRVFTLAGTIGGILLGAGASSFLEMLRAGATTTHVVTVLFGVLGTFLVALQYTRE